jgi:hypothetical protein
MVVKDEQICLVAARVALAEVVFFDDGEVALHLALREAGVSCEGWDGRPAVIFPAGVTAQRHEHQLAARTEPRRGRHAGAEPDLAAYSER